VTALTPGLPVAPELELDVDGLAGVVAVLVELPAGVVVEGVVVVLVVVRRVAVRGRARAGS
jgi:hypothetical protein